MNERLNILLDYQTKILNEQTIPRIVIKSRDKNYIDTIKSALKTGKPIVYPTEEQAKLEYDSICKNPELLEKIQQLIEIEKTLEIMNKRYETNEPHRGKLCRETNKAPKACDRK